MFKEQCEKLMASMGIYRNNFVYNIEALLEINKVKKATILAKKIELDVEYALLEADDYKLNLMKGGK